MAIVALAAAVAIAVLAATGSAKDPKVSFTATDGVDPVTAGLTDSITYDAVNQGNATLTHATVVGQLPTGATFVSATATVLGGKASATPSCSHAAGKVTCSLGNLKKGMSGKVVIFFTSPGSAFQSCGTLSFKEGGSDSNKSHTDTLSTCQSTTVRLATDQNFRGGCIGTEQEISTGSTATATDKQNTKVKTKNAACIKVEEVAATGPNDACGTGFTCKTEVSEIEHPPCAVNNPCVVTITFDSSFGVITNLFYNGVLVQNCTTPGVASPDPCILSRTPPLLTRAPLTCRVSATASPLNRVPLTCPPPQDTTYTLLSAIDARLRGG